MTRRRMTAIIVLMAAVVVCGGIVFATSRRARQPLPEVALVTDSGRIEGALAGGCTVEMLPPRFTPESFTPLPAGGRYTLDLSGPRPTELQTTLYAAAEDGQPGEAVSSIVEQRPARSVDWTPGAPPGSYILETYLQGRNSECWLYWFPLVLE